MICGTEEAWNHLISLRDAKSHQRRMRHLRNGRRLIASFIYLLRPSHTTGEIIGGLWKYQRVYSPITNTAKPRWISHQVVVRNMHIRAAWSSAGLRAAPGSDLSWLAGSRQRLKSEAWSGQMNSHMRTSEAEKRWRFFSPKQGIKLHMMWKTVTSLSVLIWS